MDSGVWGEIFACAGFDPVLRTVCREWRDLYHKWAAPDPSFGCRANAVVLSVGERPLQTNLADTTSLLLWIRNRMWAQTDPFERLQPIFARVMARIVQLEKIPQDHHLLWCVNARDAATLKSLLGHTTRDQSFYGELLHRAGLATQESTHEHMLDCIRVLFPHLTVFTRLAVVRYLSQYYRDPDPFRNRVFWLLACEEGRLAPALWIEAEALFRRSLFSEKTPCLLAGWMLDAGWTLDWNLSTETEWDSLVMERMAGVLPTHHLLACVPRRSFDLGSETRLGRDDYWPRYFFQRAVDDARWDVVLGLLEKFPALDPTERNQRALVKACERSRLDVVERLLKDPRVVVSKAMRGWALTHDPSVHRLFKKRNVRENGK